jgi:hydroxymethylglutaryl-CoA lyase
VSDRAITIREVGPRDGFQNEPVFISTDRKLALIDQLIAAGLTTIEVTSFVNAARVPQFTDADAVATRLRDHPSAEVWAFAANARGLARAIDCGLTHVSTALTVSEELNQSNFGKSTAEMLQALPELLELARDHDVDLEVTVGTAFGDTGGRQVALDDTLAVVGEVAAMGARAITLGDTVGIANPKRVRETYARLFADLPEVRLGAHFHDTRGMGVANALAAWEEGVRWFDASFGRLGGCPFAPGATGNVATEELVFLFEEMGVDTGVKLDRLLQPIRAVGEILERAPQSDVARAMLAAIEPAAA